MIVRYTSGKKKKKNRGVDGSQKRLGLLVCPEPFLAVSAAVSVGGVGGDVGPGDVAAVVLPTGPPPLGSSWNRTRPCPPGTFPWRYVRSYSTAVNETRDDRADTTTAVEKSVRDTSEKGETTSPPLSRHQTCYPISSSPPASRTSATVQRTDQPLSIAT